MSSCKRSIVLRVQKSTSTDHLTHFTKELVLWFVLGKVIFFFYNHVKFHTIFKSLHVALATY